jgi:hypothetical protein
VHALLAAREEAKVRAIAVVMVQAWARALAARRPFRATPAYQSRLKRRYEVLALKLCAWAAVAGMLRPAWAHWCGCLEETKRSQAAATIQEWFATTVVERESRVVQFQFRHKGNLDAATIQERAFRHKYEYRCASVIQAWGRRLLAQCLVRRMRRRRETVSSAAVTVQRYTRRLSARLGLERRQEELAAFMARDHAAVAIQSRHRGAAARRVVGGWHGRATRIQAWHRAAGPRARLAAMRRGLRAVTIQAACRAHLARSERERVRAEAEAAMCRAIAATSIQSWCRMLVTVEVCREKLGARELAMEREEGAVCIQAWWRFAVHAPYGLLLELSMQEEEAAVAMQSWWRMVRGIAECGSVAAEAELAMRSAMAREEAAMCIQAWARWCMAWRPLWWRAQQRLARAATRIQSLYRMHAAARAYGDVAAVLDRRMAETDAALSIQNLARDFLLRAAVTRIQSCFRQYVLCRSRREIAAAAREQTGAAVKLQSVARGRLARRRAMADKRAMVAKAEAAVRYIQLWYRGLMIKQLTASLYARYYSSSSSSSSSSGGGGGGGGGGDDTAAAESAAARVAAASHRIEEEEAAVCIAACVRGFLAARRVAKMRANLERETSSCQFQFGFGQQRGTHRAARCDGARASSARGRERKPQSLFVQGNTRKAADQASSKLREKDTSAAADAAAAAAAAADATAAAAAAAAAGSAGNAAILASRAAAAHACAMAMAASTTALDAAAVETKARAAYHKANLQNKAATILQSHTRGHAARRRLACDSEDDERETRAVQFEFRW